MAAITEPTSQLGRDSGIRPGSAAELAVLAAHRARRLDALKNEEHVDVPPESVASLGVIASSSLVEHGQGKLAEEVSRIPTTDLREADQ